MARRHSSFDHLFKILVIGNSNVGKSSLILRYTDDSFTEKFISTVGIDFRIKTVTRTDQVSNTQQKIKLQIWDTAGQERFRSIGASYYRGALGFLVMFDQTDARRTSFNEVRDWLQRIASHAEENPEILLVGNKCDFEADGNENDGDDADDAMMASGEEWGVPSREAQKLAEELKVTYMRTSAKTGHNVDRAFDTLIDAIFFKRIEEIRNLEEMDSPETTTAAAAADATSPSGHDQHFPNSKDKNNLFVDERENSKCNYC